MNLIAVILYYFEFTLYLNISITFGDFQGDVTEVIHNKDPLCLQALPIRNYHTGANSVPTEESIPMYNAISNYLKSLSTEMPFNVAKSADTSIQDK